MIRGLIALILLAGFSSSALAQDLGCTLRGQPLSTDTNIVPDPEGDVACLDLNAIDGQTVQVPENVTRIDAEGLALCSANTAASIIAPPAIIYLLDQSGSMDRWGGDPNGQRAEVVRNSIQSFYETAGGGYFSYIEFAGDVNMLLDQYDGSDEYDTLNAGADSLISVEFLELNQSNVDFWTSDTSPIQRRYAPHTNYVAALQKAEEFIQNLRSDSTKLVGPISIVLISDGEPTRPDNTTQTVLDNIPADFVPVHGVFLGSDGGTLQAVANATGGSYQAVDPDDPNSLGNVVDSLVQEIAMGGTPLNLTMDVSGADYNASSLQADTLGGYQVALDRSIPLDSGINEIDMDITYILDNGDTIVRTISFTLDVTDEPADTNYFDAGGFFVAFCDGDNQAAFESGLNANNGFGMADTIIYVDPDTVNTLEFTLTPSRYDDAAMTVTLTSESTGDTEILNIPASLDSIGIARYIADFPLELTDGSHNDQDSVLQIAQVDTLYLRWTNPEDPRDTLEVQIIVGPYPEPFAINYEISAWETDSIGTPLKSLSSKTPGEIFPPEDYPADDLAPEWMLLKPGISKFDIAGIGPNGLEYNLIGGDTAHFRLDGDTLKIARLLDYEADSSHTLLYEVRDGLDADTGMITIAVLDVNEWPFGRSYTILVDSALSEDDFLEVLKAADPEGDTISFAVIGNSDFEIRGDSLIVLSDIPFENGAVFEIPVEVTDGNRTDTIMVNVHMVAPPLEGDDSYIRDIAFEAGSLTLETGPGRLSIRGLDGVEVFQSEINQDGTHTFSLDLEPGIYIVIVGCAKRTIAVN